MFEKAIFFKSIAFEDQRSIVGKKRHSMTLTIYLSLIGLLVGVVLAYPSGSNETPLKPEPNLHTGEAPGRRRRDDRVIGKFKENEYIFSWKNVVVFSASL